MFDINFRDAYAHNWNVNIQRQFGANYMVEAAYVGSAGRNMLLKGAPNEAPAVVGVTNSDVNRPYAAISPALRDLGLVESTGVLDYHALQMKFQRRFANNFSFFNWYTWGKAIDYSSDNDGDRTALDYYNIALRNRGVADYSLEARVQLELDLRVTVGPPGLVRRLAGQRHPLSWVRLSVRHQPDAGDALEDERRHRHAAEPALGTRGRATARSTPGSTLPPSGRRPTTRAPMATSGRNTCAGPGSSTSTCR